MGQLINPTHSLLNIIIIFQYINYYSGRTYVTIKSKSWEIFPHHDRGLQSAYFALKIQSMLLRIFMNKRRLVIPLLLLAAAGLMPVAYAQTKATLSLSGGYTYSAGDYGQTERTRVHYAPVTAQWKWDEWAAKIIVPYIRVTGPGVVVGGATVGAARPVSTQAGLGDITPSLTWTHRLNSSGTALEVAGILKLPTADADKRLGTGMADFTLQLGVIQPVGKAYVNANVGRRFNGDDAEFPLNDVWKATAGVGYRFTDDTAAGLVYDFREAQSRGSDHSSTLTGYVSHKFAPEWSVQVYGATGFTDGSPDEVIGFQINRSIDLF